MQKIKTWFTVFFGLLAFIGIAEAQLGPLGGVLPWFASQSITTNTFSCSGGTVQIIGPNTYNIFNSSGTLSCVGSGTVNYAIIAGGGGGGGGTTVGGAGGGGGGFLAGTQSLVAGTYPITVGLGGLGFSSTPSPCSTSTGGTITTSGGFRIHTFTSSGTFTASG